MSPAVKAQFAALHASRIDAGLCVDCGEPARVDRIHCRPCGERNNARKLATYRSRRGSQPREMRCGLCKAAGHDRRRCEGRP